MLSQTALRADEAERGIVHVWTIPASHVSCSIESLHAQLSAEEAVRAKSFSRHEDRLRYIVAHVALRLILSRFFGVDFALCRFESSRNGKPRLMQPSGSSPIYFNLSHSGDLVMIAVSRDAEVGVDVEAIDVTVRPDFAETFCSTRELRWLAGLDADRQIHALYRLWTVKEAIAKAIGTGIEAPLSEISADLSQETLLETHGALTPWQRWYAKELQAPSGYCSVVASLDRPMIVCAGMLPCLNGRLDLGDAISREGMTQ